MTLLSFFGLRQNSFRQNHSPRRQPILVAAYHRFGLLLAAAALLGTTACESVIEVDLDEVPPAPVIEALLDGAAGELSVALSTSGPYFEAGSVTPITDAAVQLTYPDGSTAQVPEVGSGDYRLADTDFADGTYTLAAVFGGETYTAVAQLRPAVPIKSVGLDFRTGTPRRDEGFQAEVIFDDPAGEDNYYRIRTRVNGVLQTSPDDFVVVDDRLSDGVEARAAIQGRTFTAGDTVTFVLQHLDAAGYDFYRTLAPNLGGGGPGSTAAAPGNPLGNWGDGVLGAFVAWGSDEVGVVVE